MANSPINEGTATGAGAVTTPGNTFQPTRFSDASGDSLLQRRSGVLKASNDGVNFTAIALPLTWWEQRRARAELLLNASTIQVDLPTKFNYLVTPPALTGTNKANQDKTRNGLVFKFDQNGAQNLIDAPPVIPLTASPFKVDTTTAVVFPDIVCQPKTTSWYVSRWFSVAGPITSSYCLPLCLDQDGPGGAGFIEVGLTFSDSATHMFLYMGGGTGTAKVDLGASCAIGSTLLPAGPPNTLAVVHDKSLGQLFIEVNDVEVLRLSANTLGSVNLDSMPTAALAMDAQSNDANVGLRVHGGFAMVKGAF